MCSLLYPNVPKAFDTTAKMKRDISRIRVACNGVHNYDPPCISCWCVLQFLHGRGKKELSMKVVETMKIGLKDQNKGLFTVWQEIFQLPRIKR